MNPPGISKEPDWKPSTYGRRASPRPYLWGDEETCGNATRLVPTQRGTVLAQDEASSEAFQMPRSAIATGDVDAVLSLDQIAPALVAQVATLLHV